MTADHLSYKRATTVSLTGLALQALLFLVLLIYGLIAEDSAAITGALAVGLGGVIWVCLALVFHQHRLERLEAMEFESYLGSSAAHASVIGEAKSDEQPHARRLERLHKYFLPFLSLLLGIIYASLGLWRLAAAQPNLSVEGDWSAPKQGGWAISIGVGLVIVGFVFARFVAGMANQKAWTLLRAGSAAVVGSALIGAMLFVANFVQFAMQTDALLRYLGPIFAIYMIVLGGEMALNFVLNLYRPRHADEFQRPAFDSRVLAFLAAPDRLAESIGEAINYQFGFDVSSTWFYRLFARQIIPLVVLAVVVLWGLSVFTIVRPQEQGLLIVNGKLRPQPVSGLVISWPWPFSEVVRFPAQAVNELHVGSTKPTGSEPVLWTNEHSQSERFFLVQPASSIHGLGSAGVSTDLNLLAAEVPVTYIVHDLRQYKMLAQDATVGDEDSIRQNLLTALASKVVLEYMATRNVDELLGGDRRGMSRDLATRIQAEFDEAQSGVEVLFAGLVGVQPEKSVAKAFEEVVAADQRRGTLQEQAEADAIRTLAGVVGDVDRARLIIEELDRLDDMTDENAASRQEQVVADLIKDAGGEAAVLISTARADRWRRHMKAASRATSVEGLLASYHAAPGPFRVARYVDAFRDAAAGARIYITPFEDIQVKINKEEQSLSGSAFDLDSDSDAQQ